jgi:hypothetical protein
MVMATIGDGTGAAAVVLQPGLAGEAASDRYRGGVSRQGRRVSWPAPNDEPGRRSDRHQNRTDHPRLPAVREGESVDVGARRSGGAGAASLPAARVGRTAACVVARPARVGRPGDRPAGYPRARVDGRDGAGAASPRVRRVVADPGGAGAREARTGAQCARYRHSADRGLLDRYLGRLLFPRTGRKTVRSPRSVPT